MTTKTPLIAHSGNASSQTIELVAILSDLYDVEISRGEKCSTAALDAHATLIAEESSPDESTPIGKLVL